MIDQLTAVSALRKDVSFAFSLITTVCGSGVSIVSIASASEDGGPLRFSRRVKLHLTSADVSGLPLLNLIAGLRWNVYVWPSAVVQSVAASATTLERSLPLYVTRVSYEA